MKLKYTQTKIPYIEFDANNRIAFSSLTATEDNYSHLIVSGMGRARLSRGGKKKSDEELQSKERISVISDLKFNGTGVMNKLKTMFIYKYIPFIKKEIGCLLEGNCFPKKNLQKLEKVIASIDESTVDKVKETVKKKSVKKVTKVKIKKENRRKHAKKKVAKKAVKR